MRPRCACARFGRATATGLSAGGLPTRNRRASAALLGIRLKLGLEGRKLGKWRVWVDLLLALAMRGVVAMILMLGSGFDEMRPLGRHTSMGSGSPVAPGA